MCGSTTTTTSTPGQSAQNAGIWNAATGQAPMSRQDFAKGISDAFAQGGPQAAAAFQQANQGRMNPTPVAGPALPTSAPVYGRDTVAGITPDQQASYDAVRAAQGAAQPGLDASNTLAGAAGAYQPTQVGGPNLGPAAQTGLLGPVNPNISPAALSAGAGGVNASGLMVGAPGVTSRDVSTSTLPQTDLSGYMNPFTQNVVNNSLSAIDKSRLMAQSQTSGQAIGQGAFGGSRSGVMGALTNADYGTLAAKTAGDLNLQNFTNAQTQAQTDLARKLAADQGNQQSSLQAGIASGQQAIQAGGINANTGLTAGITNANLAQNNTQYNAGAINANNQWGQGLLANTGLANNQLAASVGMSNTAATNAMDQYRAGLLSSSQMANQNAGLNANGQRINAAGLLSGNATAGQNALLQGATAMNQAGTQQQGTNQAQLSSAYQQWQNQQNYPFQYYNFLRGLSTGDPNTTAQTTQQSPLGTIAGLATSAAGLLGGGGIFGGGGGNAGNASALSALTPSVVGPSRGLLAPPQGPIAPASMAGVPGAQQSPYASIWGM